MKNTFEELIFDIIGIDASIANALRRIMLAEVFFYINSIKIYYLRFLQWQ